MTRFDVAVLSFRILAIYLLSQVLGGSAVVLGMLAHGWPQPFPVSPWLLPIPLLALLGVILFWKAPAIGRSLFKGDQPMSTASRPEVGALALQLCGILLFADGLSQASQVLDDGDGSQNLIRVLATIVVGVIGALLVLVAPSLSRRLFGEPVKPLLAHVQAVTFSVVGIWLLVTSAPALVMSVRDRLEFGTWGRGIWATGATAVLGLLLFLGGGGLSAFWYWIRHAGLAPRPR